MPDTIRQRDSGVLTLEDTGALTLIGQGNTAEIYAGEEHTVIKLYRDGFPESGVMKEYRVNTRVQEKYPMMPKALGVVTCKERLGIVYEKAEGRDMFSVIRERPRMMRKMAVKLAAIHAGIHERKIGDIVSVKEKLAEEIGSATDLTDEEKARAKRLLDALPGQDALCHFDFHPGNVMMTGAEYRVIDWMTACAGDPASDIARTWLLLKYGELRNVRFADRVGLEIIKACLRRTYLKESIRLSGVRKEDIEKWLVPVAAARLSEWLTEHERQTLLKLVRKGLKTAGQRKTAAQKR